MSTDQQGHPSPPGWPGGLQLWSGLFVAASLLSAVSTLFLVSQGISVVPWWDQWVELDRIRELAQGASLVDYLFSQHLPHRLAASRPFFLADVYWFGAKNRFLVFSTLTIQLVHALILIRLLARVPAFGRSLRWFLAGTIIFLMSSAVQVRNFTWGFQVQFVLVFAAATFSISALVRCGEAVSDAIGGRRAWRLCAQSLLFAVVTSYSMVNGLVIWPILVALSFFLALRPGHRIVILTVGALVCTTYLIGYEFGVGRTNFGAALRNPIGVFAYAICYLGIPSTRVSVSLGLIQGGIGLGLALLSGWRVAASRDRTHFELIQLFILVFVIITVGLTAIGRSHLPLRHAGIERYGTGAMVFWSALLPLLYQQLEQARTKRWMALTTSVLVGFVSVVILPFQYWQSATVTGWRSRLEESAVALVVGVSDPAVLGALHPNTPLVLRTARFLERKELSLYGTAWARPMGRPLHSVFEIASGARCVGSFEGALPFSIKGSPAGTRAARVHGWAWDLDAEKIPETVLLTNEASIIRGVARTGRLRSDVAARFGDTRMAKSGWVGFVRDDSGLGSLAAYAIVEEGRVACRIEAGH